jgi:hypothetical protein
MALHPKVRCLFSKANISKEHNAMQKFIEKLGSRMQGVISGADRLVLRGSLRAIQYRFGMMGYLWHKQVPLKAFGKHAEQLTRQIKEASLVEAQRLQRPVEYLNSSKIDKKAKAEQIAMREGIEDGLICVLSCVEPCLSFEVGPNPENKRLELKHRLRKCLFFYHYWMHPLLGFMSARIQTWFPFQVQVYLNGREWLARQMKHAGVEYIRQENCFPWVADYARAQALMDEQLKTAWPRELGAIGQRLNPLQEEIFDQFPADYYWSVAESEWATDVGLRGGVELRKLFPQLVEHGMLHFSSSDVLRLLGHPVTAQGKVHGNFQGEITTDLKRRAEGARVKHRVNQNAVKMYDKAHRTAGSVLRIEMTMNNQKAFRVYRPNQGEPQGEKKWRRMRRGLADLHRRAEVSQQVNERYLDALASVDDSARLHEILSPVEKRKRWKQRPVRALHPFSVDDSALLEIVSRGEFMIAGLCNRDVRDRLFPSPTSDPREVKRRSALVSRKLCLLRAHGILHKVKGRNLYQVSQSGRTILTMFLLARQARANQLMKKAA